MKAFSQEWNDRFMVSWRVNRDIPTTVSLRQPYTSLRRWPSCEHPAYSSGSAQRQLLNQLGVLLGSSVPLFLIEGIWLLNILKCVQVAGLLVVSLRWGCFKWEDATEESCYTGENVKESLDDRNKLRNVFKCFFLSFHHLQYIKAEERVPRGGVSREKKSNLSVCESACWESWGLVSLFAGLLEESQFSEV